MRDYHSGIMTLNSRDAPVPSKNPTWTCSLNPRAIATFFNISPATVLLLLARPTEIIPVGCTPLAALWGLRGSWDKPLSVNSLPPRIGMELCLVIRDPFVAALRGLSIAIRGSLSIDPVSLRGLSIALCGLNLTSLRVRASAAWCGTMEALGPKSSMNRGVSAADKGRTVATDQGCAACIKGGAVLREGDTVLCVMHLGILF